MRKKLLSALLIGSLSIGCANYLGRSLEERVVENNRISSTKLQKFIKKGDLIFTGNDLSKDQHQWYLENKTGTMFCVNTQNNRITEVDKPAAKNEMKVGSYITPNFFIGRGMWSKCGPDLEKPWHNWYGNIGTPIERDQTDVRVNSYNNRISAIGRPICIGAYVTDEFISDWRQKGIDMVPFGGTEVIYQNPKTGVRIQVDSENKITYTDRPRAVDRLVLNAYVTNEFLLDWRQKGIDIGRFGGTEVIYQNPKNRTKIKLDYRNRIQEIDGPYLVLDKQ